MMSELATDAAYLAYQYGDAERLKIRQEAHRLYSEGGLPLAQWLLPMLAPAPSQTVLDVGCGSGMYHTELAEMGVRVVGLDLSYGMLTQIRKQTAADGRQAEVVQATAERLPIATETYARLMANHMLYHVPDQLAALREMRRVLKPGGRLIITANSADAYAALYAIHEDAAHALGYTSQRSVNDAFNSNHIARVRTVFPNAEVHISHGAFVFPDADAALRFYASMMIDSLTDMPADRSHRQALLPLVRTRIEAIIAREGVLRVPKGVACFTAEKLGVAAQSKPPTEHAHSITVPVNHSHPSML